MEQSDSETIADDHGPMLVGSKDLSHDEQLMRQFVLFRLQGSHHLYRQQKSQ